MPLRRAAAAALSRLGRACGAAAPAMATARQQGAALAQTSQQLQQARPFISVDVQNGNVDRAWRTLSRKLRDEGYLEEARDRQYFVKPSERRKLEANASRKRLRDQEFREMLQWVMRRKSRGF